MTSHEEKLSYEQMLTSIEADLKEYPPTLQAKHISQYLGVGMGVAYNFLKSGELPSIAVPGSKFIVIPKSVFTRWYAARLCKVRLDEMECDDL